MKKIYLVLSSIGFLLTGIGEASFFHILYDRYFFLAIIQWPVFTAVYTIVIVIILTGKLLITGIFKFILCFTGITCLLTLTGFLMGYPGFYIAILLSGVLSIAFIKLIQSFIYQELAFSPFKVFLIGTLAYIMNLVLLSPFFSDLLLPFYYNKGTFKNVLAPFFIIWNILVGTYSIQCLLYKKVNNPFHIT